MAYDAHSNDAAGVVRLRSGYPFDDTVRRLLAAFAERGIKVFASIDQQAEALAVGISMPPTTLILFGNPKAGTPLMLANPQSGLDLPLKALVTESPAGEVDVTMNDAAYIIQRHGLPAELLANLAPVERLVESVLRR
ncbi:MAG TPA: DUF302 domain-containing protein [Dyella sp.]|uniref:DUF302 domain-containing protein n=1 Tax=Dyella sp. TaxID=1869338 RepID=UPI002C50AECB|nr:DUF302 domain-containing protein [Dyella sp.]HTV84284.1 DUF302 domain-containing protein [Dyella sp.]